MKLYRNVHTDRDPLKTIEFYGIGIGLRVGLGKCEQTIIIIQMFRENPILGAFEAVRTNIPNEFSLITGIK